MLESRLLFESRLRCGGGERTHPQRRDLGLPQHWKARKLPRAEFGLSTRSARRPESTHSADTPLRRGPCRAAMPPGRDNEELACLLHWQLATDNRQLLLW